MTIQPADQEIETHDCVWDAIGTQLRGTAGQLLSPPQTTVLLVCRICHLPCTVILSGHWDKSQLGAV